MSIDDLPIAESSSAASPSASVDCEVDCEVVDAFDLETPSTTHQSTGRLADEGAQELADVPRVTGGSTPIDKTLLWGSGLSSLALTWLLLTQLFAVSGTAVFLVLWYAAFLAIHFAVCAVNDGRLIATDKLVTVVVLTGAAALMVPLVLIVGFILVRGLKGLSAEFFTSDLSTTGTLDSGGGLAHALMGTIQQVCLAVILSVPLGVLTAVFLNEVKGPIRRPVRMFVDAMSGVPSIVAGLFIYAVWIVQFGKGFSGFAAAMALAVLMLPTITRTAEEVLRLVPAGLREAALALGAPEWRTTWSVVLPTARTGLVTAVVLGVARAVGETAPLIMTSFGATVMNADPFSGAQASLPLSVYQLISNPFASQQDRAYAGALVLIFVVLALFVTARLLSRPRPGRKKRRLRLPSPRTPKTNSSPNPTSTGSTS